MFEIIDRLSDIKVELYKLSKAQEGFKKDIERITHNLGMHILEHSPKLESDQLFNIFGRESIFETLDDIEKRLKKLEKRKNLE